MEKDKQIKGIQELDKTPLFCNQMTVSHSLTEFFIDFRTVYPQFAPDNTQTPMVIHRTIVVGPYHLKEIIKTLNENVEHYEKEYSKIKEPVGLKKARKRATSQLRAAASAPEYMG